MHTAGARAGWFSVTTGCFPGCWRVGGGERVAERVGEWVDVLMEVFSRSSQLAMKGYGEEYPLIRSVSRESGDILTLLGLVWNY